MQVVADVRSFGGRQLRVQHASSTLKCSMHFSLYLPPACETASVPLVTWLSGLTCNDENFVQKAGAQRVAARLGIAILTPDTSPRGDAIPDDPDGAWDFGLGAGFYLNATQEPWSTNYRMYDYIIEELPALLAAEYPLDMSRQSVCGHSMGGHGALTLALRNPQIFQSVSAFSPICAPSQCPWGEKAFSHYLGGDQAQWRAHDAVALIGQARSPVPMLVDQGSADNFLQEQLKTPLLEAVCKTAAYPASIRMQDGYDHSYFFIASFIEEHLAFHADHLAR